MIKVFNQINFIEILLEDFFLQFFILSSGYIENKTLMVINISNHDNIKTTSNANGCLQIAITTHNYLQISNTKHKKHCRVWLCTVEIIAGIF
jgi:helix-turn-helix protein